MKNSKLYSNFRQYARKVTLCADEAEDLLQTALLAAIEAGRTDMACGSNRRWLMGVIRKRAAFDVRTAVRRRAREASVASMDNSQTEATLATANFVGSLPPKLKTTALLALTGHTKAEIAYLLRLSDSTLRQRIMQIKRRWRQLGERAVSGFSGLADSLAYGRIRKALLTVPSRNNSVLGTHDPDGHLFMVTSQNRHSRQHRVISIQKEE